MSEKRNATSLILAERDRQIKKEGWSAEHDDAYINGELERAGRCYLLHETESAMTKPCTKVPADWPWIDEWWKPKGREANLIRAGALFLAASDRQNRAGGSTDEAMALYRKAVSSLEELLEAEAEPDAQSPA